MARNDVFKLGGDATEFLEAADKVAARLNRLNGGLNQIIASSGKFNQSGKVIGGTFEFIVDASKKVVVQLDKEQDAQGNYTGKWVRTSTQVKQSVSGILRELKALQKAQDDLAKKTKIDLAVGNFRKGAAAYQRTAIPQNASLLDTKDVQRSLRDIERIVAAGDVSGKRALAIIDNVRAGKKQRLKGEEEDLRQHAIRLESVRQKLDAKVSGRTAAAQNLVSGQQVAGVVRSQFGPLNPRLDPAKAQGSSNRLETLTNSLAERVERGAVSFTRFQDLVNKTASGTADATNRIERNVVRLTNRIISEHKRANDLVGKADLKSNQGAIGTGVVNTLKSDLPLKNLTAASQERISKQLARVNQVISKSALSAVEARSAFDLGINPTPPAAPPTSRLGRAYQRVTGNTFSGGPPNTGPPPTLNFDQEKVRQAGASVRRILQQEISGNGGGIRPQLDLSKLQNIAQLFIVGSAITRIYDGLKSATDEAGKFEKQIALIKTITQDQFNPKSKASSDEYGQRFGDEIKKASENLGISVHDVGVAAYDLLSNQITTGVADTISTLEVAGVYARTTNSSIADSVNLLSSAINTYNLDAGDAERVSSQFFTTIDLGRVQTAEMANTFGRVAQFGKTLGVTLEELQASIITITQTGQRTDTTFTLINNVLQKLLNPTKELQKLYDDLGVGTGEIFVKTYTFVGALKKLQEESHGSKAALADFFNEIRAFGGIDALTSRFDNFSDALEKVKSSSSNAKNAKEVTKTTGVQRLAEETQKLTNLFQISFGQKILDNVIALTDSIGGLANVVVVGSVALATFGSVLIASYTVGPVIAFVGELHKYAAIQRTILGQTYSLITASQLLWAGAAAAGVAIGVAGALAYDKWIHAQDALREYQKEQDKLTKKALPTLYSEKRQSFKDTTADQQKVILKLVSSYVVGFQKVQETVAEAAEKIRDNMGSALRSAVASLKDSVSEIESELKDHLKAVNDFDKHGRDKNNENAEESQFRYALKDNEINRGNSIDREAELYKKRYIQINKEIAKARAEGNYDKVEKALDKREHLATEQRDLTTNLGHGREIFRYTGGARQVEQIRRSNEQIRSSVRNERAGKAEVLVPKLAGQRNSIREIESLATQLENFKTKNEKGELIFGSKEETLKKFDALQAELSAKIKAFRASPDLKDPLFTKRLTDIELGESDKRVTKRRVSLGAEFEADQNVATAKKSQIDLAQAVDDGNKRFLRRTQAAQKAREIAIDASGEAQTQLDHFTQHSRIYREPIVGHVDPTSTLSRLTNPAHVIEKREAELSLKQNFEHGNLEGVEKDIDRLLAIYKKVGDLGRTITGAGGNSVTVEKYLTDAKKQVQLTRQATTHADKRDREVVDQEAINKRSVETLAKDLGVDYARIQANATLNKTTDEVTKSFNDLVKIQKTYAEQLKNVAPTAAEDKASKQDYKKQLEGAGYDPRAAERRLHELEVDEKIAEEENLRQTAVTKAYGGPIFAPKGTDTIPAMLTKGEYVMPADKTARYAPILNQMRMGYYASGGVVDHYGSKHIELQREAGKEQSIKQAEKTISKIQETFPDLEIKLLDKTAEELERGRHDTHFSRGGLVKYFSGGGTVGALQPNPGAPSDKSHGSHSKPDKGVSQLIAGLSSTYGGNLLFDTHNPHISPTDALAQVPGSFDNVIRSWSLLRDLKVSGYAQGGLVGDFAPSLIAQNSGFGQRQAQASSGQVNVGDINVSVNGGSTSTQTLNELAAGINRGIRRGTINLRR